MEDLDGDMEGPSRRRVFAYLDYGSSIRDSDGHVKTIDEVPIPRDYNLELYEVSDFKVAYYALSSPFLDGNVVVTEQLPCSTTTSIPASVTNPNNKKKRKTGKGAR